MLLAFGGSSLANFLHNRPLYLANLRLRVEMPFDVHPDHWATYNFVKLVTEQRALRGAPPPSRLWRIA